MDQLTGEQRRQVIEDIKKVNPGLSFPTVIVEDKVIIGFDKSEIEKAREQVQNVE